MILNPGEGIAYEDFYWGNSKLYAHEECAKSFEDKQQKLLEKMQKNNERDRIECGVLSFALDHDTLNKRKLLYQKRLIDFKKANGSFPDVEKEIEILKAIEFEIPKMEIANG
jgi:hypothetical protein